MRFIPAALAATLLLAPGSSPRAQDATSAPQTEVDPSAVAGPEVQPPAPGEVATGFGGDPQQELLQQPATLEQAQALQRQILAQNEQLAAQQQALLEQQAQLEQLQQQVASQAELEEAQLAEREQLVAEQTQSHLLRAERLRSALTQLDAVDEVLEAGSDDYAQWWNAAQQDLQAAAGIAGVWGSAPEANALEQAIAELNRVPELVGTRNTHLAHLALLAAKQHAGRALSLAESAPEDLSAVAR